MRRYTFTTGQLLAGIAVAAVACAAARLWVPIGHLRGVIAFAVTTCLLVGALIPIVFCRDDARAYWIGFAAPAWIAFLLSLNFPHGLLSLQRAVDSLLTVHDGRPGKRTLYPRIERMVDATLWPAYLLLTVGVAGHVGGLLWRRRWRSGVRPGPPGERCAPPGWKNPAEWTEDRPHRGARDGAA